MGTLEFIMLFCLCLKFSIIKSQKGGFPGGSVVKNPAANTGDPGLILIREDPTCLKTTKPTCPMLDHVF